MTNQSVIKRSDFKPQIYENSDNSSARIERDLRRLEQLIEQSKSSGLNSIESSEKMGLIDEYGLEHHEAFNLQFKKDS